jgi:hypothetical protein
MPAITGGLNQGNTIDPNSLTGWEQGKTTISQDDVNRWLAMGGSNIFSQLDSGQWWGPVGQTQNIEDVLAGKIPQAITSPYGVQQPQTTGAPLPATGGTQTPPPTTPPPASTVPPTTPTTPTTSTTPSTSPFGDINAMRTFNTMQNIYGTSTQPGPAGSDLMSSYRYGR